MLVKNACAGADHKGSFTTFFCASEHNGKIHVAHPQNKMVMGSVARACADDGRKRLFFWSATGRKRYVDM